MSRFRGEDLTCVRGERLVFTGLGFDLGPGDALLVLGPNGSGKSSLLRLMAGLTRPVTGWLAWDDVRLTEEPERHRARLHYVGHEDAVKPQLTAAENVAVWAGLRANATGTGAALAAFGLAPLADLPARLLSAGQRRRLALSRVSATPATLWLLDEPTVALDRESVTTFEAAVAAHREAGGIAVIATNTELGMDSAATLDLVGYAASSDAIAADRGGRP